MENGQTLQKSTKIAFLTAFFLSVITSTCWADESWVVATSHPLAAQAGRDILQEGGNAIDAAIAVQLALNVVEPQSSGLGGGFFMLIYDPKSHHTYALDARETAPQLDTADQFMHLTEPSQNGLAVGVPGTLAGLIQLHNRWGHLSWEKLFVPAIDLAQNGFAVTPYLAQSLKNARLQKWEDPLHSPYFNQGKPLSEGEWLRQPELANTLKLISKDHGDSFYHGQIAQAILKTQQQSHQGVLGKGRMTEKDLVLYHPIWRTPITISWDHNTIVTMPPPSAGGVALQQVMNALNPFQSITDPVIQDHLTIEALRLALMDRNQQIGDPKSMPKGVLKKLLNSAHLKELDQAIKPQKTLTLPTQSSFSEGPNTTQFSLVDRTGWVVSCTSTIEDYWGSGLRVKPYGFFLNNELTDFNITPQSSSKHNIPNDVSPNRRPRSSMTPTLVFHNQHWSMAYGSPGGLSILSTVTETTAGMLIWHRSPQDMVNQPRFWVGDIQGTTYTEPLMTDTELMKLRQLGHTLIPLSGPFGSIQMVGEDPLTHQRWGLADPRREGAVLVGP